MQYVSFFVNRLWQIHIMFNNIPEFLNLQFFNIFFNQNKTGILFLNIIFILITV